MKKIVSLMLCIFMLSSVFALQTSAAEDSIVSYALSLEATAPKKGDAYALGETVTVTVAVSTRDAMGNEGSEVSAPVYAFNGVLNYNSFLLKLTGVEASAKFASMTYGDNASAGRVTFSYLCGASGSELVGVNVGTDFVLASFTFKTLTNGVTALSLSDMVLTDKAANARPIVSAPSPLDISIGTGETTSNEETLTTSIEKAKAQLGAAVMNPTSELIYPAFTVSQATYDALDAAIKAAEKALVQAVLPDEFLEAEKTLNNALYEYDNAKLYGRKQSDISGIIGGIVSGEKDLIEVTASAGANGKIVEGYEKQFVRYGTSVTVLADPDEGYEVEKVVVNGVKYPGDTTVTIASVSAKTHIEFFFRQKPKAPRFTDVARGSWYFDAVEKIAEIGLFAGTSATEFSPNMPMTRAMLVTVLHRLDGKPAASAGVMFGDVAANEWYTDAIAWASENRIVNGYTSGNFGTNDSISRQDMVTILYRYLKYKGLTPADGAALDEYIDAASVSDYAKPAMQWAYAMG
ncbi:MAG: S-layer homology domain-containing protein, partial [Clostridia bacterium]|nr:S-layer homology domain-containing protein [Clostridia bacterium]